MDVEIRAREQFVPLITTPKRWSIAVCHRRAGKTVACVQRLMKAAIECKYPDPRLAYVAPLYNQAKDVAWSYVKKFAIPLGATVNESELRVDLRNGARIRLYGADNPDRLRGLYLDEIVLDEYADMHPDIWGEIIRPMLADRQGRATFIGTPKGHNAFYKLWTAAKLDPEWYSLLLKASETGLISGAELIDAKRSMSEDQYAQEFECSFEAAIKGAYFAKGLAEARVGNRIGFVPRDPHLSVRAYWDIGGTGKLADATSIWIVQFVAREIRLLNYYEAISQPLATHIEWLRSNGYDKIACILPHDGAQGDKVHATSYEASLRQAGFPVTVVPNQGTGAAKQRIEAARRWFPSMWFNEATTKSGIEALAAYHERWDDKRDVGLGPDHDWSSHCADAFGLMAISYDPPSERNNKRPIYQAGGWMN